MTAYRKPSRADLARIGDSFPPAKVASGLVRANGSACTCRPPGRLWCWWVNVQRGDRWLCAHGGAWVRVALWERAELGRERWEGVRP